MFIIFRRKKPDQTGQADWLVVGLGNPGKKYEMTRHNCGFLACDLLSQKCGGGRINKMKCQAVYTACDIDGKTVVIAKPQTYMNLSGQAVQGLELHFSVPAEHIIVVQDDVALPSGRMRIRRGGSDGGHNGIKNIIYLLRRDDFPRVKIGVGAPDKSEQEMADYVLSDMDNDVYDCVKRAPDAVLSIIKDGVDLAMQVYNTKA